MGSCKIIDRLRPCITEGIKFGLIEDEPGDNLTIKK